MTLRYLVPALAVIGSVSAAICDGPTTISSSADAAALSACSTFSGDIAIATSNSDDIALDGIKRITGSLTIKDNHDMYTLSAENLATIDDSFTMNNVSGLSTLTMPSITNIDTVDWIGLPGLSGVTFTAGLTQVSSLSIQNTNLATFEGINLMEVDTMFVANNYYLNDISMPLETVGTGLTLSANGDTTKADFSNLQSAANISLSDCNTISLDSLSTVNGSLGFYTSKISAITLTNLTNIQNSFAIVGCPQLTNVSAPSLKNVGGGLIIANNTNLEDVTSFNRLQTIGGAIDMTGAFKDVTLPAIKNVKGTFNLQSTSSAIQSSCNKFKPLHVGNAPVLHGGFTCKFSSKPKTIGQGGGNGGSGTSGGSSTSSGAANPIYISGATGVMGVVAAIFGML